MLEGKTVAVVVPAYNEEQRLAPTLDKLHAFLQTQPLRYEIVVVDDGSKDKTCDLVISMMPRITTAMTTTMMAATIISSSKVKPVSRVTRGSVSRCLQPPPAEFPFRGREHMVERFALA